MKKKFKKFKTLAQYWEFFNAIPNRKWRTGLMCQNGTRCMMGHLGYTNDDYEELRDDPLHHLLRDVLDKGTNRPILHLYNINDVEFELGNTPKERVLNAITLAASGILKK